MATVSKFEINGQEYLPPIEWHNLAINVAFDNDSVQGNINFSSLNFVDESNEQIKAWFNGSIGMTEGIPLKVTLSDVGNYVPFTGYLDWHTYNVKSSFQSEMELVKVDSLNGLFERSQGITMLLLEQKGVMPTTDGVNIPYVIYNRNTKLENLILVFNTFMTFKTIVDEIFKLAALVAQLVTLGAPLALLNLVVTIANLVLLINRLIALLQEMQDIFLPPIRYHRGIKLKTFLERGCQYMGYTLDTGVFGTLLDGVVLCPHKTDEIGVSAGLFGGNTNNINTAQSGILKPNDFGYILSDAFELCNRMFHTKIAVINNIVILKPFNDISWINAPSFTMPDVLVEDTEIVQNGSQSYNIADLVSRTLISYQFDDSDKWTISNVNDSVSETIVTPINISNQRHVTIKGVEDIQIPYCLAIRTDEATEIVEKFATLVNFTNNIVQSIRDFFDTIASALGQDLPPFNSFAVDLLARESSMKIENHFFSTPKIVYLENGLIPSDYVDKIGAIALYNNYHNYKSFVPGIKDPNNINNTNQKKTYKDVVIPFGATSFNQIINNSFFTDINGNLGKFTNVNWEIDKDKAIVSYYIFETYNHNLTEITL